MGGKGDQKDTNTGDSFKVEVIKNSDDDRWKRQNDASQPNHIRVQTKRRSQSRKLLKGHRTVQ